MNADIKLAILQVHTGWEEVHDAPKQEVHALDDTHVVSDDEEELSGMEKLHEGFAKPPKSALNARYDFVLDVAGLKRMCTLLKTKREREIVICSICNKSERDHSEVSFAACSMCSKWCARECLNMSEEDFSRIHTQLTWKCPKCILSIAVANNPVPPPATMIADPLGLNQPNYVSPIQAAGPRVAGQVQFRRPPRPVAM